MAYEESADLSAKAYNIRQKLRNIPVKKHIPSSHQYQQLVPTDLAYEIEDLLRHVENDADPVPQAYADLLTNYNNLQKSILRLREEISGIFPGDNFKSQILDHLDDFITQNIGGEG